MDGPTEVEWRGESIERRLDKYIVQLILVKTVQGQRVNDGGMTCVSNESEVTKCYCVRAGTG